MKHCHVYRWAAMLLLAFAQAATAKAFITGIHVHNTERIPQTAALEYGAIRLWDSATSWEKLEPYPGQWQLDRLAEALKASRAAGYKVILTLGNTPRWASSRPNERCAYGYGCAAEPVNYEDWRDYVATVAKTFRGQVECYEPWNEVSFPTDPVFGGSGTGGDPNQFFTGTIQSMVQLARIAYEEIKRADPAACVLSPSFHYSGNWAQKFDKYLDAGGGKYFDVVSQHFYFAQEPEQAVPVIRALRSVMQRHGLAHIPLWNTEVGTNFFRADSAIENIAPEERIFSLMLRTYLLNASEGVRRVYWYAYDNGNIGFRHPSSNKDLGSAPALAINELLRDIEEVQCSLAYGVWRCRVNGPARRFDVLWKSARRSPARSLVLKTDAYRWGSPTQIYRAGTKVFLDERPLIIDNTQK